MKKVVFVKKHEGRWKTLESFIKGEKRLSADELSEAYIEITDHLSYAKTFYPDSSLVTYLNQVAYELHNRIYKNKRVKRNIFVEIFKIRGPLAVYKHRKKIMLSTAIFIIAIIVGLFSTKQDESFTRLILGDNYVNRTIEFIEDGDPMAIYKGEESGGMFFMIGTNNIRVAFLSFAVGLIGSIFSAAIMVTNGIMVGAFIYFFVREGLFWLSFTTIMIHGTLELSAICIAGGAGIILGNAWMFPGTFPRMYSLRKGARDALDIMITLTPVIFFAAVLESYVTRHYLEMGMFIRICIMLLSAGFMIWYYVFYPLKVSRNKKRENSEYISEVLFPGNIDLNNFQDG